VAQVDPRPLEEATGEQNAAMHRLLELNEHLVTRTIQLENALASRVVIEQAKGILFARHRVAMAQAFDALRRGARSSRTRLHELAERVVAEPETPPEVARYLEGCSLDGCGDT
jgi:AmiR/NasT family two-component response regulator